MSMVSVPAIYDGKNIRLLEAVSFHEPYRVLVTFVEPISEAASAKTFERFWASFGAWQAERPIEETLRDLHATRLSRREPPSL